MTCTDIILTLSLIRFLSFSVEKQIYAIIFTTSTAPSTKDGFSYISFMIFWCDKHEKRSQCYCVNSSFLDSVHFVNANKIRNFDRLCWKGYHNKILKILIKDSRKRLCTPPPPLLLAITECNLCNLLRFDAFTPESD